MVEGARPIGSENLVRILVYPGSGAINCGITRLLLLLLLRLVYRGSVECRVVVFSVQLHKERLPLLNELRRVSNRLQEWT